MLRIVILGMLVETNVRRLYINARELIPHNVREVVFFNVPGKIFFSVVTRLNNTYTF